jgi:hypothetical protein
MPALPGVATTLNEHWQKAAFDPFVCLQGNGFQRQQMSDLAII